MAKWLSKLWSKPDPTKRSAGQNTLLQAVRLTDNRDIGKVIASASIDDLEWFLQMRELQLEETPHWVKDPERLEKFQAWNRRVRTMTVEVLHNKRKANRLQRWLLSHADQALGYLITFVLGGVLTWLITRD